MKTVLEQEQNTALALHIYIHTNHQTFPSLHQKKGGKIKKKALQTKLVLYLQKKMEIPNEFYGYPSAATSPISVSSIEDGMNFYSAPTSPTSDVSNTFFGSLTEPTTPTRSYDQDFEFATSRRFNHSFSTDVKSRNEKPQKIRDRGSSPPLPAMAFADELFCDGKVVPLAAPQLKLPPGFFHGNDKFGSRHSVTTEPRSPRSVVRLPFPRPSLWNDDFDPFMVALENVKVEEKRGKKMEGKNSRRARSLSPLRSRPDEHPTGFGTAHRMMEEKHFGSNGLTEPNGTVSPRWAGPQEEMKEAKSPREEIGFELNGPMGQPNGLPVVNQERKCPKGLAEPKGVVFARRVRQVKMDQENPNGPNVASVQRSASERGHMSNGSGGGSTTGENKRQKIMRLLFRVASSKKESDENKVKEQNATLWKPTFLRRLSFKSREQTQYNGDKSVVSQVAKMTIIQYRPRLSLCIGHGPKY